MRMPHSDNIVIRNTLRLKILVRGVKLGHAFTFLKTNLLFTPNLAFISRGLVLLYDFL